MNRIIIIIFYLCSILHALFGEKEWLFFLRIAQIFGLIAFVRVWSLMGVNLFEFRSIIRLNGFKVCLLAIASTILIGFINFRLTILPVIYPISFLGVSLLISKTKLKINIFIFISFLVFILLSYYFKIGMSPTEWVKGSRNHVSVLVLYISIMPLLIHKLNNGGTHLIINIILPILAFTFSLFAIGRSGIMVSGIYLLGNMYLYLINHKNKYKILLMVLIVLYIMSNEIMNYFEILNNDYLYKINNRGLQLEARQDIIDYYFSKINFITIFFSIDNLELSEKLGLTLHNSYLSWHFRFGFFSFIILYISLKSLFQSLKANKSIALILLVILIRSFTDQILLTEGILLGLPFILSLTIDNYKQKI